MSDTPVPDTAAAEACGPTECDLAPGAFCQGFCARTVPPAEPLTCDVCGSAYLYPWRVDDVTWERVTGRSDGSGRWCPSCFIAALAAAVPATPPAAVDEAALAALIERYAGKVAASDREERMWCDPADVLYDLRSIATASPATPAVIDSDEKREAFFDAAQDDFYLVRIDHHPALMFCSEEGDWHAVRVRDEDDGKDAPLGIAMDPWGHDFTVLYPLAALAAAVPATPPAVDEGDARWVGDLAADLGRATGWKRDDALAVLRAIVTEFAAVQATPPAAVDEAREAKWNEVLEAERAAHDAQVDALYAERAELKAALLAARQPQAWKPVVARPSVDHADVNDAMDTLAAAVPTGADTEAVDEP